jgi:RNA polymerase sigma factor (sigma-70 family)
MLPENENNNRKLNSFFSDEYHALKKYVRSKILESADRDAEDIIQDVALKLFSRNYSSPINNVAGFVYGSIKNKIIDIMRTRKMSSDIEEEAQEKLIDFMVWLYDEADNSYSERMKHELKQAMAALKPAYRDVIIAIDFDRLSYKELSEITGISQGTLMSRRHRALSILNNKLTKTKNIHF